MNEQPEVLRLADALEKYDPCASVEAMPDLDVVAAELRRLHQSEREGWRYAAELEQTRKELLEALAWIDRRCPAAFLLQDLHKVHIEAAFDAGVCARAAITKVGTT